MQFYELEDETVWGATARILTGFLASSDRRSTVDGRLDRGSWTPGVTGGSPDRARRSPRRRRVTWNVLLRAGGTGLEVEIGIGKSGRRAYGFDDIAIVPSRRTRDPEDVDITWELDAFRFEPAGHGIGDGRRAVAAGRDRDGPARRRRVPQPRGSLDALRRPRRAVRGDRRAAEREGHPADAGDLRRADQGRADRSAHPRDQGRRRHRVRVAHAAARRAVRQARARGRARHPRDPGHGRVGGARVEDGRAAQPQEVHPRVRHPGDRRRVRVVLDRAAPHAHRRGRRARGRRPRPRVHEPRRARHRRAAGHRHRRRRRRPHPSPRRDRRVRARHRRRRYAHRAATSPRRSPVVPTR